MATNEWIDISVPLSTGMVHWPDNPAVHFELLQSIDRGDVCNVTAMSLGAHTGTHMDAPCHFVAGGAGIDSLPLDALVGPARVIEISDPTAVTLAELRAHSITAGERVLFKTRNSTRCGQAETFVEDFVYIAHDAARFLAAQHVRTVGVDYLSVGGFRVDGVETHQALLRANIAVIEGLNLSAVGAGNYELICLPLKIVGSDGAPARAILRPR